MDYIKKLMSSLSRSSRDSKSDKTGLRAQGERTEDVLIERLDLTHQIITHLSPVLTAPVSEASVEEMPVEPPSQAACPSFGAKSIMGHRQGMCVLKMQSMRLHCDLVPC